MFLKGFYDPSVEDGFAEIKTRRCGAVERKLSGSWRGQDELGWGLFE